MMQFMTRLTPRFARRIVKIRGDHEVIACGLRPEGGGKPIVIFSPIEQEQHIITLRDKWWHIDQHINEEHEYLGEMVKYRPLKLAQTGEVYQLAAKRKKNGRKVVSPFILIKDATIYDDELLKVEKRENSIVFDWQPAKKFLHMIFFVCFTDEEGRGLFGMYSRDTRLTYPKMPEWTLFLKGRSDELRPGQKYQATLLVVDYEGWVPAIARQEFTA